MNILLFCSSLPVRIILTVINDQPECRKVPKIQGIFGRRRYQFRESLPGSRKHREEKMKKKVISAVLSTAMLAGLLAGCGLSGGKEEAAPAATEAAAPAATEAATEAATTAATEAAAEEAPASGDYTVNDAASKDPAVTLTMAEVNPLDNTICGAMDTKFKEAVEAMSGGSITVDLQGSGVLGVEADILDGMLGGTGTVDICRISAFALSNYGAQKSVLLSLPYTFQNKEHFWAFANSDLGTEFLNEPVELGLGVRGLYFGEEGFRSFFTAKDKPVSSPDDMKGMKIRVSNDPIMTKMVENLGATPSPVSMSEVYSSLQNGTIDGAEQPVANYLSNSFQEVGPNLTLDEHTLGAMETIISDAAWGKLTENQQQVIMDAGKIASDYCHEVSDEKEQEALDTLKSQGINVIEISDKSAWQAACKPIADKYAAGDLADLYQKILDLAK